jgi:threonine dehydrogenase-like Zn-dependent dehydrogenase
MATSTIPALVYVEPGRVEWQEVPEPRIASDSDAIVRPLAVARCDLDPIQAAFGLFPGPFVVGHETVAEVVEVGDAVLGLRAGDRVVVPFQVSCGDCFACRQGRYGGCVTYPARAGAAFGFGPDGGGFGGGVADLLRVPHAAHLLQPAPTGIDASALATLPDNVVDAYRAVAPGLAQVPGADVLVLGGAAASIGLYAVAWAMALGAGSVRYVDSSESRLAAAAALGAETVVHEGDWPKDMGRAVVVVENTATADGLVCALRSTEAYGLCTSVAIHFQPVPFPMLQLYTRGITFHTSRADSRALLPAVLEHIAAGTLDPAQVPTTVVPWAEAAEAWTTPAIKVVLAR